MLNAGNLGGKQSEEIAVRYQRLQSLFPDRSFVLRFWLIALVVSILLFISKASLFETSAIAQIPTQSPPSNPWKYQ
jgi:hypothetical protein